MNERHQPSGAVVACSRMQKKKKSELGIADQAVLYMMISYIFFLAKNPGVDGVVNIT